VKRTKEGCVFFFKKKGKEPGPAETKGRDHGKNRNIFITPVGPRGGGGKEPVNPKLAKGTVTFLKVTKKKEKGSKEMSLFVTRLLVREEGRRHLTIPGEKKGGRSGGFVEIWEKESDPGKENSCPLKEAKTAFVF